MDCRWCISLNRGGMLRMGGARGAMAESDIMRETTTRLTNRSTSPSLASRSLARLYPSECADSRSRAHNDTTSSAMMCFRSDIQSSNQSSMIRISFAYEDQHLVRRLNTAPIFWFHTSQICEGYLSRNMINCERRRKCPRLMWGALHEPRQSCLDVPLERLPMIG